MSRHTLTLLGFGLASSFFLTSLYASNADIVRTGTAGGVRSDQGRTRYSIGIDMESGEIYRATESSNKNIWEPSNQTKIGEFATKTYVTQTVNPLTTELKSLQSDIAPLKTDLAERQSAPNPLTTELKSLQSDMASLKKDLAETQSAPNPLTTELKKLQSDIAPLKKDLAERQSAPNPLTTELKSLQSDMASLKKDLAETQSAPNPLTTELKNLQSDMASLKKDLAEIQSTQSSAPESFLAMPTSFAAPIPTESAEQITPDEQTVSTVNGCPDCDKIRKNDNRARNGNALASALAMVPQVMEHEHLVGVGAANNSGKMAFAVGYSQRWGDERQHVVLFKAGIANSIKGGGVSYGYSW